MTPRGSPTCWPTASSGAASSPRSPSRSCGTSPGPVNNSSARSPSTPCASRRPSRTPISNSRRSSPMSWGAVAAPSCGPWPAVSETVARVIVAEIGFDMTRFPTAGHLVSWAGLCPRLHESAGKRLSNRTRSSNPWLKTTLVQAAWAAARKKDSYCRAQFLRIKSRRGPKKAVLAVAASMLTAAYHMLKHGVDYRDLGADHFDRRDKAKLAKRLIARLHDLGLTVEVRAA